MQPGVVGLRSAVTALWAEDLRTVREDRYDTDRGKEALAFIQRFNATVSQLRAPIQQAWGPGGLVHVADNPDVAGPGQRVSQVRIKLRNHGDAVVSEGFGYSAGSPSANPSLGLDREIKVAGIGAFQFVQELYGTLVGFLQTALNVDLVLANSLWLFEQVAADYFTSGARWPTLGELYQSATREFAIEDSFQTVTGMFKSEGLVDGDVAISLSVEQLHRCRGTQADMDSFMSAIRLAVEADQAMRRITRDDAIRELNLDEAAATKLGRLLALAPDICRDREGDDDYSTWSFLPSYNVHFFRRVKSIDDYLATVSNVNLTNGFVLVSDMAHPARVNHEDGDGLPDGVEDLWNESYRDLVALA